jgi:hypothetical protein
MCAYTIEMCVPYLLNYEMSFSPQVWCFNMWGCLKFVYGALDSAKPDHSKPDHVEPNQAPHCQIVMYKQKKEQSTSGSYTNTSSCFFGTLSVLKQSIA